MAWLAGWAKRIALTMDHNDITAALTDFPFLMYLSASSGRNNTDVTPVFDEVGANSRKIAVTLSDGTTECNVEIERWNAPGVETAWLWVKAPNVSQAVDQVFYLYYDNTQGDNPNVNITNTAAAEAVWDANFKLVTHMRDDPDDSHVRDSTANNNDGVKRGADEPLVTTAGMIDDAQDFDGSNDRINIPDGQICGANNAITIEAWIKQDTTEVSRWIVGLAKGQAIHFRLGATDKLTLYVYDGSAADVIAAQTLTDTASFHHVVGVYRGDTIESWIDGVSASLAANNRAIHDLNRRNVIGSVSDSPTTYADPFNGIIDEVRISNIARSASWINASYESERDDLIAYGAEETPGWSGEVSGVTDPAEVGGVDAADIAEVKGVVSA